jgi:uncharacterized membrane protein YfcA
MEANLLLLAVVGAGAGLIAGLVGLAGGVVIVPALIWLYGPQALHAAIVTSWFAVVFNSFGAAAKQWRLRTPCERSALFHHARWYLGGALVVTPLVAALAAGHVQLVTSGLVAVLQLCLAAVMLAPVSDVARVVPENRARDTAFGGLVGGVSTLIGVGGGTYTIAYFVYGAGARFRDAIATANIMGFCIGVFSVLGFGLALLASGREAAVSLTGPVGAWGMTLLVLAGLLAAPLGVMASTHLPVKRLRQILIAVLVVSAGRLLLA